MTSVIKFQSPFERLKQYNNSPYVVLCKAILMQAITDATNISNDKEAKRYEIESKAWLFGNSEYFQQICFSADMEPSFVVKISKQLILLHKNRAFNKSECSRNAGCKQKTSIANLSL